MKNKKILILALVIIASIIVFSYNINQNISKELKMALIEKGYDRNNDKKLSSEELNGIRALNLGGMKLVSIKGIRMMENLEYLYLDANRIKDFADIYNLSNLIELDVSRVQIDKNEHFFDITSIKHLYLKQCELDSLENMVPIGIESLYVSGNQVVSIDGFEKLQNLQKLYCDNNQITDIGKLQYLNQLRTLDIRNNPILDLSVLLDLTLLKELKIDEKQYEIMLNEGIFDKISNYVDIIVWP